MPPTILAVLMGSGASPCSEAIRFTYFGPNHGPLLGLCPKIVADIKAMTYASKLIKTLFRLIKWHFTTAQCFWKL